MNQTVLFKAFLKFLIRNSQFHENVYYGTILNGSWKYSVYSKIFYIVYRYPSLDSERWLVLGLGLEGVRLGLESTPRSLRVRVRVENEM